MTFSTLTKDYPRYPSVLKFKLTDAEKDKLMVMTMLQIYTQFNTFSM